MKIKDELNWTRTRPTVEGLYWIAWQGSVISINVWESPSGLFTGWDGGAPILDETFDNAIWMGPIERPELPRGEIQC